MNEVLITTVAGLITGFAGWYAARKKNIAETKVSEIDAVERAIKVWRDLSEDLQLRYEVLIKKVDALQTEIDGLRSDNKRLSNENKELIKKIKHQ